MWNNSHASAQGAHAIADARGAAAGTPNLGEIDLRVAELMLPGMGEGWSLTRYEDYDGILTLLLEADEAFAENDEAEAADGLTFAIHRSVAGIQLGRVCQDHYNLVGCFPTVGLAMHQACQMAAEHHRHGQSAALTSMAA